MPLRNKPGHEKKPDGRIKRQVKHEEERADRRDVADPPEGAAEINQANQVAVTDRLPPRLLAPRDNPPRGHQRDPAAGRA